MPSLDQFLDWAFCIFRGIFLYLCKICGLLLKYLNSNTFYLYKRRISHYNDYAKQKTITILGKLSIFIIEGSLSIPFYDSC